MRGAERAGRAGHHCFIRAALVFHVFLLAACTGSCDWGSGKTYPHFERAPEGRVYTVTLGADGKEQRELIPEGAPGEDKALREVWDYQADQILNDRKLKAVWVADCAGGVSWTYDIDFTADGTGIVACGRLGWEVRSVPSLEQRFVNQEHTCWEVAIDPRGRWFAAGDAVRGGVWIVDMATGQMITHWEADTNQENWDPTRAADHHSAEVQCLEFSADGTRLLVTTSDDWRVWVYDTASWKLVRTLHEDERRQVFDADFTLDGSGVLVFSKDHGIVYDLESGAQRSRFTVEPMDELKAIHWLAQDRLVFRVGGKLQGEDGVWWVMYDLDRDQLLLPPAGEPAWDQDYDLHAGRGVLVSGNNSHEVCFRSVPSLDKFWVTQLSSFVRNVALSPDGTLAAAVSGGGQYVLLRVPTKPEEPATGGKDR